MVGAASVPAACFLPQCFSKSGSASGARFTAVVALSSILEHWNASKTLRVRLRIIGNLETMHGSDLPTFLIISMPIIFKRTVPDQQYGFVYLTHLCVVHPHSAQDLQAVTTLGWTPCTWADGAAPELLDEFFTVSGSAWGLRCVRN